jgi:hypothetical protein
MGKGRHTRTVPVPDWVKAALDDWTNAAGISDGRVFRCVSRKGSVWGNGITEKVIWHIVKGYAKSAGIQEFAPHDCRRSCARLCHAAGGELEQIQFLLGHVSVETTERCLGCKQRLPRRSTTRSGLSREPQGPVNNPAGGFFPESPLFVHYACFRVADRDAASALQTSGGRAIRPSAEATVRGATFSPVGSDL